MTSREPRRIVKTIPGQSTVGADDILVDDQGDRWQRYCGDDRNSTVPVRKAELRDGWLFP